MERGKLVRDRTPEIIRAGGHEPITVRVDEEEFGLRLRDKLREEVDEYLAPGSDPAELADILEVVYALARQAGLGQRELEDLRSAKARENGAFGSQIVWFGNKPLS